MKVVLAAIFTVVVVVLGLWFDIGWALVGGIEQIVHGAQASPVSASEIAWGVVRVLISGIGFAVAIWLSIAAWVVALHD
jgi:hypothetical protein